MNRKKVTIYFIVSLLLAMFLILPILYYLGLPKYEEVLAFIFGENNPLAWIITIIIVILIIRSVYNVADKKD